MAGFCQRVKYLSTSLSEVLMLCFLVPVMVPGLKCPYPQASCIKDLATLLKGGNFLIILCLYGEDLLTVISPSQCPPLD